jgi:S1-C subfamily serine protease
VKLGELQAAGGKGTKLDGENTQGFGLGVEPLTNERGRELGVGITSGVVVNAVAPDSAAARAGFQAHDVIEQVDGKAVATVDELRAALQAKSDRPALLLVHRKDRTLFLTLKRG